VQYKLHTIAWSNSANPIVGITIPKEITRFFSGCYFKVEVTKIGSKYGIFCESGALLIPTEKEIKNYDFQDIRV